MDPWIGSGGVVISFDPTEDERAIQGEVRRFAEKELAPRARRAESGAALDPALEEAYAALGIARLEWPESAGGAAGSLVLRALVEEELAAGCAGLAIALDRPGLAGLAALELASGEGRGRLLAALGAPGVVGALALEEQDTGSGTGHVSTRARRDGDGFRLSGRKLFVAQAPLATHLVVIARVDGGQGGAADLGAFVVEGGARGLMLGREDRRLGLHALRSGEMLLEDVEVPETARLVPEGDFRAALDRLLSRMWVVQAARQVGVARAALTYACGYAQERSAFGRKIGQFQGIAFKLADMAIQVDAARGLVWRAARERDRGRDALRMAALALLQANEAARAVTIDAVQTLGGAGFMEDYPVEKWMRDAHALASLGGGDPARVHLAAERDLGPEGAGADAPPEDAFAAFGAAFGGGDA